MRIDIDGTDWFYKVLREDTMNGDVYLDMVDMRADQSACFDQASEYGSSAWNSNWQEVICSYIFCVCSFIEENSFEVDTESVVAHSRSDCLKCFSFEVGYCFPYHLLPIDVETPQKKA